MEFGAVADVDFSDVQLGPGGLPAPVPTMQDAPLIAPPALPPLRESPQAPPGTFAASDLEALLGELGRQLEFHDITLPVPARPDYQARYRLVVDAQEMQPWRRLAYDPTCLEGINQTKLACLGLSNLNTGLLVDGREVIDDLGDPITFASPSILGVLKAKTPADAVRIFYGFDAHVTASWTSLLAESGFGTMLPPVDAVGSSDIPERPDPS